MLKNEFELYTSTGGEHTHAHNTHNKVILSWCVSKATVKPVLAITEIKSLNKYVLAVSSGFVLWGNYECLRGPATGVLAVQNRHVLL